MCNWSIHLLDGKLCFLPPHFMGIAFLLWMYTIDTDDRSVGIPLWCNFIGKARPGGLFRHWYPHIACVISCCKINVHLFSRRQQRMHICRLDSFQIGNEFLNHRVSKPLFDCHWSKSIDSYPLWMASSIVKSTYLWSEIFTSQRQRKFYTEIKSNSQRQQRKFYTELKSNFPTSTRFPYWNQVKNSMANGQMAFRLTALQTGSFLEEYPISSNYDMGMPWSGDVRVSIRSFVRHVPYHRGHYLTRKYTGIQIPPSRSFERSSLTRYHAEASSLFVETFGWDEQA